MVSEPRPRFELCSDPRCEVTGGHSHDLDDWRRYWDALTEEQRTELRAKARADRVSLMALAAS